MDIKEIRKEFPILENRNITYLDSGATTQKPNKVIESINEFYKNYNVNIHRGAYSLSIETTAIYEETRAKIAKFINARYPEEIIYNSINDNIIEEIALFYEKT